MRSYILALALLVGASNVAPAVPILGMPSADHAENSLRGTGVTVAHGYCVVRFADIASPAGIAFDSNGNLYVGNAASSGYVRLISSDGTVVENIGDLLVDPDFVVFDEHGFVGNPGSVLVGAGNTIMEVDPNTGETTTLFSGSPFSNVGEMELDGTGRLFAGQVGIGAGVVVIDEGVPSVFCSVPDAGMGPIAIDKQDSIFVGVVQTASIFKLDSSGTLLGDPFASIPVPMIGGQLAYASIGPFSGDLFANGREDGVFRFDGISGEVSLFMSGLEHAVGLAVGPQGDLFVGDFLGDAIYRVSADCNGNDVSDLGDIVHCDGSPWCGDCNGNGIPDSCDIVDGASQDNNQNYVPDECESSQDVPTVSAWGVALLTLLTLTMGIVVLMRRGSLVRR